jgi:nitrite reductase/ring-hydroxylating ferredoxin subunit
VDRSGESGGTAVWRSRTNGTVEQALAAFLDAYLRLDRDEVRAFYNLCRHRGTQLCDAERGEFPGAIRCPYHAWTYDYDGRLAGAPHMDGSPGFNRKM